MIQLFRYQSETGPRVGAVRADGKRYDLTTIDPLLFGSIGAWLAQEDPIAAAKDALEDAYESLPIDIPLLAPVDSSEVWAAGVTYERSKVARQEESAAAGGGDFYDRVYSAERPELFFKSVGWRVSAPGAPVRIRRDSTWDVPEPEMTLVLSAAGKIVGVTVGNDMSSRSIEGENPLYLPQAKSYDGACAVGPTIVLMGAGENDEPFLTNLPITLTIRRDGEVAFSGETSTARMKRTPEELAGWLFREMSFPRGVLLMTGTGVIPPEPFTLKSGDEVTIAIAGVGTLNNPVH